MPPFVQILIPHLKAHFKATYITPEVASRTVRAPFLFKCCRVGYNKETNRLEIRKGEYVGKTVSAELPVEIYANEDGDLSGQSNRCIIPLETYIEELPSDFNDSFFSVPK